MELTSIYRKSMLLFTLLIAILFLINYMIEVRSTTVSYEPKKELATLVETIEYRADSTSSYEGMNLYELSNKLEKSLNSNLKGYGYKFASYALELGVDPYLALAIVLEETGCTWGCSNLVVKCNNIGGMKGTGCGEYQYFPSLEAGIEGFLDNLSRNYYAYGLTTADTMNPKYAENPLWARNVNAYIERIKSK